MLKIVIYVKDLIVKMFSFLEIGQLLMLIDDNGLFQFFLENIHNREENVYFIFSGYSTIPEHLVMLYKMYISHTSSNKIFSFARTEDIICRAIKIVLNYARKFPIVIVFSDY